MRLICPNCDAQYEVDASLIPAEGRDVQCSACNHVWFQAPDLPEGAGESPAPAAVTAAPVVPEPEPSAPEPDPEPEPEDPQVLRRHSLDESMLAVLREEAERETRARAEENARAAARSLEMQPELGLTEAPAPRLRIRPRAQEPEDAAPPPVPDPVPVSTRAARRELLPDIEAINSTLDASSASRRGGGGVTLPEPPERRRAGFRIGFVLMIALAVLAWAVYSQSARIGQAVPAAQPALAGYVALMDKARLGLDALMQGALNKLSD
ncbi:zinc-ribbon domain-containing protein [Gemmobacter sp.]|uniref:zinc-ribbon domain-containing protein n=1 Tax=Gemmobacter sp. TaxID=1898957 RepID=UPI002AFEFACB|nr:zinc-ribbon domain-containing protein [Gemmobacter sp.]